MSFRPGQFGFLSLRLNGRWQMWHPFSISSADTDETLSLTIKSLGDFTQRVPEVKEGDRVKLDLPYGAFSIDSFHSEKYVLIAGGVGITPICCMLRAMHCDLAARVARRERPAHPRQAGRLLRRGPGGHVLSLRPPGYDLEHPAAPAPKRSAAETHPAGAVRLPYLAFRLAAATVPHGSAGSVALGHGSAADL